VPRIRGEGVRIQALARAVLPDFGREKPYITKTFFTIRQHDFSALYYVYSLYLVLKTLHFIGKTYMAIDL
jgi:hypothetical protein